MDLANRQTSVDRDEAREVWEGPNRLRSGSQHPWQMYAGFPSRAGVGAVEIAPARTTTTSYERTVLVAVDEEDCFVLKEDYAWRDGVVVREQIQKVFCKGG